MIQPSSSNEGIISQEHSFRDSISRQLYNKFIDKFSDKFVNFIRDYESQNDKIG